MARDPRRWRVAVVQLCSTADLERNLGVAEYLARRAADTGARLVALPEHFARMPAGEGSFGRGESLEDGRQATWLRNLATELGCYLLAGSVPERIARSRRVHNTSLLVGPTGDVLAAYRKMHLFDARVSGGAPVRESRAVAAGDRPVVVDTELGRLGLTICYDLRFPELYRHLAKGGAEIVFVPAAFTAGTGRHHWMPLLRARAIENQFWVVAPAQSGRHGGSRVSHGRSAVIDPRGNATALLEEGEGVVTAEIDLEYLAEVREELPCLRHMRPELLGLPRCRTSHPA